MGRNLIGDLYPNMRSVTHEHIIYFNDAKYISELKNDCVDLVITSPPYYDLKDYGNSDQIGFSQSYDDYLSKLKHIFGECVRVMKPSRIMAINIGEKFVSASDSDTNSFKIIPIPADILHFLSNRRDINYLGTIQWRKITTSRTSGGGNIMGSYPYPRKGRFFSNSEPILIFEKIGKNVGRDDDEKREMSKLSKEKWRKYFNDVWNVRPEIQSNHPAMFPIEIPKRLIAMYSIFGDTVLDPFMGSGTTIRAASVLGRKSIGFEIGFISPSNTPWKRVIREKITVADSIISYIKNGAPAKIRIKNIYTFAN